mgnify:CR=1
MLQLPAALKMGTLFDLALGAILFILPTQRLERQFNAAVDSYFCD